MAQNVMPPKNLPRSFGAGASGDERATHVSGKTSLQPVAAATRERPLAPRWLPSWLTTAAATPALVLAIIMVITVAVYSPIFRDWFKTDDFHYLHAGQTKSVTEYVPEAFDFRDTTSPVGILEGQYRPLYAITILSEVRVFGLHPLPYHIVSILIHLGNVLLVWLIAMRLMRRLLTAHLAAAIFALHPTYVTTVGWISEHTAMLATLMALVSFWSFLNTRDGRGARDGRTVRNWWYALSVATYLAAMFYHPKAASIIVAYVAYCGIAEERSTRDLLLPRTWLWLIPYLAVAAFPLILGYELRERSLAALVVYRYGPHVYRNYAAYLRMSLWPIQVDTGVTPNNVIPTCIAWFDIVLLLLWSANRRRYAVPLLWYFAALLPLVSSIFGANPRELYVAGPALALILAATVVIILDAIARYPRALVVVSCGCAIIVALSISLAARNARHQGGAAREAHAFIAQLKREQPELTAEDTLYIVGPPSSLILLGTPTLYETVHVFYPDVAITRVTEPEARKVEAMHDPHAKVLRFSRS